MCVGFEPTLPALTACTHACKHFPSISGPVCQPIHLTTYDSKLQSTNIVSNWRTVGDLNPAPTMQKLWRSQRESNSSLRRDRPLY